MKYRQWSLEVLVGLGWASLFIPANSRCRQESGVGDVREKMAKKSSAAPLTDNGCCLFISTKIPHTAKLQVDMSEAL